MRSPVFLVLASSLLAIAQPLPPASVDAPPDAKLLLTAKASGVQKYACTDGRWVLTGPDAKLKDNHGHPIGTHFAGPTWRLSDGSEVKGKVIASKPSPDGTSIPWLLVDAVPGSASGKLAAVAYIRRTDTHGGAASTDTCSGGEISIPYTATYVFYIRKPGSAAKPANWVPSSPIK